MQRIKSKDTKPEIKVRKLIFEMGYRFRLHWKKLPGKPDIVFPGRRKVIFVHGCFWHQHNIRDCSYVHKPKSRLDYWLPKLERNIQRDNENQKEIEDIGWEYIVIWECQINNPDELRKLGKLINNFLK